MHTGTSWLQYSFNFFVCLHEFCELFGSPRKVILQDDLKILENESESWQNACEFTNKMQDKRAHSRKGGGSRIKISVFFLHGSS